MKLPPGHIPGVGLKKPTAYGGLGEKLLKQYGWKEGEGLGSQGSGIKSAVKVFKKEDTIGVGGRQVVRENSTAKWWQESFDKALQNLREAKSADDSSESDADDFDVSGRNLNRDGTLASGSAAELRLAQELAKDAWGRFGGRNGKMARIRAQEAAMAADQAGQSLPILEVPKPDVRPKKRQRKDRPDSGAKEQLKLPLNESLSEGKQARKLIEPNKAGAPAIGSQGMPKEKSKRSKKDKTHAKQVLKPQPESLVILHGDQVGDTKEGCVKRFREDPAVTATPSNWWGASKFVAAGCLGGLRVQDPSRASDGFTEDTQAELYMKAHAVKTAGKKGLGSGQGKAVGHEWRGTKTIFEDSEPKSPSRHKHELHEDARGRLSTAQPIATSGGLSKKLLAKASRHILKKAEGNQLKLSKLIKKLTQEQPDLALQSNLVELLVEQIEGSKKLVLDGKVVRLRQ